MRQFLVNLIKIAISLLLIGFLVHTAKLDFKLFSNFWYSPLRCCLLIILYLIVIAMSTTRWYWLNTVQGVSLSYKQTLLPTYLGIAFNNLLPGGVGGDFFRFYMMNKQAAAKKSTLMLSILFDRITGLLGLLIAVSLVAVWQFNTFLKTLLLNYSLWLSGIVVFTAASAYLILQYCKRKNKLVSLMTALAIYRHAPVIIIKCLAISTIIQIFIALTCLQIATIMNFPSVPLSSYVTASSITQIVNLVPIAPGGIGIGEVAFANTLFSLNPTIGLASATIFLAYRLIGILIYLPGVAALFIDKSLVKQLKSPVAENS